MINKAYQVIVQRQCPTCGLGFTSEINKLVYQCDYSKCSARFDFSVYSAEEIKKEIAAEQEKAEKR